VPGRQTFTLQLISNSWTANTTAIKALTYNLRGANVAIPSSLSFTASAKLSRGGGGVIDFVETQHGLRPESNAIGTYKIWSGSDDTDIPQFIPVIPTTTNFFTTAALFEGDSVWTAAHVPIPSSLSFTASSKLSRGGGGVITFVNSTHGVTNASSAYASYFYDTGILRTAGGGDIINGTAAITVSLQVGAGVLVNGAATMSATGSLTAILTKEETGTPASMHVAGTLTCNANASVTIETGMYGGVVTNNRSVEAQETISGSMVLSGVTARFSDLYAGYYDRRLAWGYTNYPAANFKQPRSVLNTGYDWLPVNLNVYSVMEQDVTPESSTLSGTTSWTTDFYSGYTANWVGTLDNLTYARNTQVTTEVLAQVSSNARLTQVAHEVLISPGSRARHTQTAVEVLRQLNVGWIQQEAVEAIGNQISALRYALIQQCALEVMYSIKAKVNLTQVAHELLKGANPDPPVNLTSVATEVLRQKTEIDTTPSFVQQVALESLRNAPNPPAVINHIALEYVVQPFPPAVINHVALEWFRNSFSIPAVVNHMALERVRDAAITPTFVQHIAVEILVRPEFDPTVSSLINNPKFYF
jgi:hypothetical protein